MSKQLSNIFLSAFTQINKITEYLEEEIQCIESKPTKKVAKSILFLIKIIFVTLLLVNKSKRRNPGFFADFINFDALPWVLIFLAVISAALCLWLYGSIFSKGDDRTTLEPILENLWGDDNGLFTAGMLTAKVSQRTVSRAKKYTLYMANFLNRHKPGDKKAHADLINKIDENYLIISLCIKLLIYLKKNIKTYNFPDFDYVLLKCSSKKLKKEILELLYLLPEDLREKCRNIVEMKDHHPSLVQSQIQVFMSRPDTDTPRPLRFLDCVANQVCPV